MSEKSLYIRGLNFEQLMALFMIDVHGDDDFYDAIAEHIVDRYSLELAACLKVLSNKRLRSAIYALGIGAKLDPHLNDMIEMYIFHQDENIVSAALDALRRAGSTEWRVVEPLLENKSPYIRGAALRFCRARLGEGAKQYLIPALDDQDYIVRENALDELEGVADSALLNKLNSLLSDSHPDVRAAAQSLIDTMVGDNGG